MYQWSGYIINAECSCWNCKNGRLCDVVTSSLEFEQKRYCTTKKSQNLIYDVMLDLKIFALLKNVCNMNCFIILIFFIILYRWYFCICMENTSKTLFYNICLSLCMVLLLQVWTCVRALQPYEPEKSSNTTLSTCFLYCWLLLMSSPTILNYVMWK